MILTNHMNFEVATLPGRTEPIIEAASSFETIRFVKERKRATYTSLEFVADNTLEAAIFLATISADPERAAMFKMFWSGE